MLLMMAAAVSSVRCLAGSCRENVDIVDDWLLVDDDADDRSAHGCGTVSTCSCLSAVCLVLNT